MSDPIYHVDGDLVPASEATVSVDDRGFRYGDAAFETVRLYGGTIFEWDAHADRLAGTCDLLALDHGLPRAELRERIEGAVAANGLVDAYARLSITRGIQPGKLTPSPEVDPTVVVYVSPLPRGGVDGESVPDGPATLETVDIRRVPDEAIPASAKTHNYLNGILARLELTAGDEALVRTLDGAVAEGTTSNVFVVDDGELSTPPVGDVALPGVTRQVVLELAAEAGIPTAERRVEPAEVREAEEVFLTNTTGEVWPVGAVDGRAFDAPGPVTDRLATLFDERVERRCYG